VLIYTATDALFGVVGPIKRIKIYRDTRDLSKSKGDALVTFVRPEAAYKACVQLHNTCIEESVNICVTKADFKSKTVKEAKEDVHNSNTGTDTGTSCIGGSTGSGNTNAATDPIPTFVVSNYTTTVSSSNSIHGTNAPVDDTDAVGDFAVDDFLNSLL